MKRICAALLIGLFLLLFSACQPTPAEDVVVNRGDGVYEQKLSEAQATATPNANGQKTASTAAPVPYLTELLWQETMTL